MDIKRGLTFSIVIVFLMSILIIGANSEVKQKSFEISSDILEKVQQNDVRVYINLKSETKNGRSIASSSLKREVTNDLGNVKHVFDDKISAIVSQEELLRLQNNSEIESIELVGMRTIFLQDSAPLINATPTWSLQKDGTNLTGKHETICILDTGIDFTHPDLNGRNLTCIIDCVSGVNCVENCSATDWHGHGTHVAGIAGASGGINGIANEANFVSIQVCDSGGNCPIDSTEAGIQWCVDNSEIYNISVISMSLGADCDLYPNDCHDTYCDVQSPDEADNINNAVAKNISVIIAAGNDYNTTDISEPACVQNATPIGSSVKLDNSLAPSSNRNGLVLLIAPGAPTINSTVPNGACTNCDSSGYKNIGGTSMATPHVAGAFAIINQYKNLVGSPVMLPSEIEDALNDSGKVIYDSGGSGLNFSRINIYQTLLDIDVEAPEVTLISPVDNALSLSLNQTFNCSAEDILQLGNLTFNLWNSTGDLINQTSYNATANNFGIEINITLDSNGTYTWNCFSEDNNSNSNFSESNYTVKIDGASMTLNAPSDNSYTTTNETTFNCSFESTVANLSNVTLKIWNSSGLFYNVTSDVTGSSNESVVDYNLSTEAEYDWNCLAFDEDGNSIYASSNYTLTFDQTAPVVTLIDPDDEDTEDEGDIDYQYSVSDLISSIASCSLYMDDDLEDTDNSVIKDITQTITFETADGTYDWYIKCYDDAGNSGSSEEIELNVDAVTSSTSDDDDDSSSSSSSSDDSSSTTTTPTTIIISDVDILKGVSKTMKEEDVMKFNIKSGEHILKMKDITAESIKIIISSDPITLLVNLNETKKVDIDNDNYYEIEVTYEQYQGTNVKVAIKAIFDAVGTRQISNETNNTVGTGNVVDEGEPMSSATFWIIIGSAIGVVIFGGSGYLIYLKKRDSLGPIFSKKYKKMKK